MDASIVERHSELLSSIEVDGRLNGTKIGPNTVVVSTDSAEAQELIGTQYMNLHRLPENLQKVQLVTDPLSTELLNQQVVELTQGNEFVSGTVGNQYYDDDLLPHDLTEDDKRLAAALVAVQFVQQQKQQHTSILASELLNGKRMSPLSPLATDLLNGKSMSPLSPLAPVPMDKPGMAAMVTSYIQAFDDDAATQQQLLDTQNHDRILKLYQTPSPQLTDMRLPPLPPLKKSLMRNRYSERNLLDATPVSDASRITIATSSGEEIHVVKPVDVGYKTTSEEHLPLEETEEGESDLEAESDLKSSRKSLPHKKRIPRKLKAQPSSSSSIPATKRSAFSCEICGVTCMNQAKFFEHLKGHYEPPLQGTSTTYEANKEDAVQQVNCEKVATEEEMGLSCGLCGRHFKRQKALETHMTTAHPQIEEFSEPEDIMEGIRHVVSIQAEASEESDKMRWRTTDDFGSEFCNTTTNEKPVTSTASGTIGNVTSASGADSGGGGGDLSDFPDEESGGKGKKKKKLVHCPHCSRTFTHRNSLLYHVRSYSGRRLHQCDVCGKGFFAANALRVHMRMHSGDKPYKCEVCGRNFRQWGDLKYHMTSLHSNTKQYQCEFCGKDFARKYSLIVHRRIHTGEKNYVCEFCRKTFRASSYLVNHRRIHTGEKPYNCDVCHKPFRVKSDMKRHRNIHNKTSGAAAAGASAPAGSGGGTSSTVSHGVEPQQVPQPAPAPLDLKSDDYRAAPDEFRQTSDANALFVWIPSAPEEALEESILPD